MPLTSISTRPIAIAPMLDWTDRFFRYFFRQISQHAWLYTEMVTTGALLNNAPERFLQYHAIEHPIALQLGGSDPLQLAQCTKLAARWGYDEVNLNVGCPSARVQSGSFGACLMAEPHLVADCVKAMQDAAPIPITIKHRIGIDKIDAYAFVADFVGTLAHAGCHTFIVHARNAILKGLSPKENREIPPLKYDYVYRLKQDFPTLEIIINGGIKTIAEIEQHLLYVDGVMIGREAYHNPYRFAQCDSHFYQQANPSRSREDVVTKLKPFIAQGLAEGVPLQQMIRPILGLYQGVAGSRYWRRLLSDTTFLKTTDERVLDQAQALIHSL
jgi:tRNA-dihydrouridine synthase A